MKRVRLSRSEVWVVHHVATDRLIKAEEQREPKPWWAISATKTLEDDGRTFRTFEAWRLRRALVDYANDDETPTTDASIASAVARRLGTTFEPAPVALRRDEDERLAERR